MSKLRNIVIISVIACSILLNSICLAAELYPDVKGTDFEIPVYALAEIKVINSSTGNFDPTKEVTREEFVKLLVNAQALDSAADVYNEKNFFNDVSSDEELCGYVNVAYDYGYITYEEKGTGENVERYFHPDEKITYTDALVWCVKTLGYSSVVESKGTIPNNYLNKASELKLKKDMSFRSYDDKVTRGNAVILVWNMINARMWDVVPGNGTTISQADTLFEKHFSNYTDEIENIIKEAESVGTNVIDFSNNQVLYEAIIEALEEEDIEFEVDSKNKTISLDINEVKSLDLSDYELTDISELEIFSSLEELDISHNSITDVSALSKLSNLISLDISDNKITDISSINNLNLRELDISKNVIVNLAKIKDLTNLQKLYMSDVGIRDITFINNFKKLRVLDISDNIISNIDVLTNLVTLTDLNISSNYIKDMKPIQNLTNLTALDISNNEIKEISAVSNFVKLTKFFANNTLISDITPLKNLTKLTNLGLSGNKISDMSAVEGLTNLTFLNLDKNVISEIKGVSNLNKLIRLDLSYNSIKDLKPLSNMTSLSDIILEGNEISDLTPLKNLNNLNEIQLSRNHIADFSAIEKFLNSSSAWPYNKVDFQTLTMEININETKIELPPIFKNQEIKTQMQGNVKINVDKENMMIENANTGDKAILTITNGTFKDSTITYTFVGTPPAVTPTPTPTTTPEIPKNKYQITTKVPTNCDITPAGTIDVEEGQNVKFEIDEDKGYDVKEVLIDGKSVGKVDEYTFTNVMQNHTIEVLLSEVELYTITAKQPQNGTLTPTGVSELEKGDDKTYRIKANSGYGIEDVIVDGKSVGKVSSYKFKDIDKNHTIEAKFVKIEEEIIEEKIKFDDVTESDWFSESVKYVTEKGLMNGVGDNKFSPNSNTTRGMIVTVLYRLAEVEEKDYSTFDDVSKEAYYSKAIAWAAKKGIVNGVGNNKFAPDAEITREQLITILNRYAEIIENEKISNNKNNLTSYNDNDKINTYAVDSFKWGVKEGIITGRTEKELAPQGTAKRSEVATMLMRFIER